MGSKMKKRDSSPTKSIITAKQNSLWWCTWPIAAAVVLMVLFRVAGSTYYSDYILDLGSSLFTTPRLAMFLVMWMVFGTGAALLGAVGILRFLSRRDEQIGARRWMRVSSDTLWIAVGSIIALIIPILLRILVLHGAPLTDDESAYRFMAELLSSGRLRALSPPLKLFFDRIFMINDGHMHAAYFLGWPALMAPGIWLGIAGFMNAHYCSLTVAPIFLVLRRLVGSQWARLGIFLYLLSTMLMVGAATELSHTSCLMALAWLTWFVFRARDEGAPAWTDACVAIAFGIAFMIRPVPALGIGIPLLLWWAFHISRMRNSGRLVRLAAFMVPALAFAGLFFAANKIQNGSFIKVSYMRHIEYMQENGYRFSYYRDQNPARGDAVPSLIASREASLANVGVALFRLNFDLFGWPCFLFACFAGRQKMAWLIWTSLLCYFAVHLPLQDTGIDSFGPTHYFEAALPILFLNVLGIRAVHDAVKSWRPTGSFPAMRFENFPLILLFCFALLSLLFYVPVRLGALSRIAENVNMPIDAVRKAGLQRAVVFAPQPFAPNCRSTPTASFVFWRPNNDPDLRNDILWVNHINVEENKRLMRHFPDRTGYVMEWVEPCRVILLPLNTLTPGSIPDGSIGGTGLGPNI
jgi:hypothetical protein